jgi:hypothetical protein
VVDDVVIGKIFRTMRKDGDFLCPEVTEQVLQDKDREQAKVDQEFNAAKVRDAWPVLSLRDREETVFAPVAVTKQHTQPDNLAIRCSVPNVVL